MNVKRAHLSGTAATFTVILIVMVIACLTAVAMVQTRQSANLELARAIARNSEAQIISQGSSARVYLERDLSELIRSHLLDHASEPWPLSNTPADRIPSTSEIITGTQGLRSSTQRAASELCAEGVAVFLTQDTQCGQEAPALPSAQLMSGRANAWQRYRVPYAVLIWNGQKRKNLQGAFMLGVGKRAPFGYALAVDESVSREGDPVSLDSLTTLEGDVYIGQVPRIAGEPLVTGSLESASCVALERPCQEGEAALSFPFGTVSADALRPSSQHPCYGQDCPKIQGGLDLQALALQPTPPELVDGTLRLAGGVRLRLGTDEGLQRIETCYGASCTQYRVNAGSLERLSSGVWQAEASWHGVIYVQGKLEALSSLGESAAIAPGTQLSLIARDDARIVGSLYYSNPPCQGYLTSADGLSVSNCANLGSQDLLSLTSLEGDVLIGNGPESALRAPHDLSISAALAAPKGAVGVENSRSHKGGGQISLLGAVRARYSSTWGSYLLRMQYDPRLNTLIPPAFKAMPEVRATVGVE